MDAASEGAIDINAHVMSAAMHVRRKMNNGLPVAHMICVFVGIGVIGQVGVTPAITERRERSGFVSGVDDTIGDSQSSTE